VIGMTATRGKVFPDTRRPGGETGAVTGDPEAVTFAEAVMVDDDSEDLAGRERRLIEAVVSLARSLRDERDRLAERLREVESQLGSLAQQLEHRTPDTPQREA
jgi:hypothetical protein